MNRLAQPSLAVRHLAAISILIVLVGGPIPGRLAIAQAPDPALADFPTAYVPPQPAADVQADWWATVQEQIRRSEYDITWQDATYLPDVPAPSTGLRAGAYQAPNRAQNLRTTFAPRGPIIIPRTGGASWQLALQLVAWGWAGAARLPGSASLHAQANRIEYRYPDGADLSGLVEWYVNGEQGLEQGFTVPAPPAPLPAVGEGGRGETLVLELAFDTDLVAQPAADGAVELVAPAGAVVLRYGSLYATDAAGHTLPTRLELVLPPDIRHSTFDISHSTSAIRLSVDAAGARFPISVDPVITGLSPTANWTVESDQAYSGFGDGAGTAGDVNGDGYDDVIIGAPAYDNGQSDEGRAFLYYGSASGLSTTPAWTAESDQASANFGAKGGVGTAGDVNGDGYADVIVGAQQYDNGQTDEGAAWVWYGSATGLGPSGTPANADWSAESNQAAAYFGHSVGTAGDVNGDGYADIIVGAYGYDGDQSNEGRVFIYYGGVTGLSTSVAWTAESDQTDPSWFTAFGWSAGTVGDVNGDGCADVIVGAARYDRGQTDEGAAFVWHGSASGLGPNGNPANADWIGESNQGGAEYGVVVGAAGDVNGDGYADVFATAHWYDGWRGRAYVYHGSASGLSATASWSVGGDLAGAELGWTAGGAGDVNGDGYADIIIGAVHYTNGEHYEGRAYVYHGASTGLSMNPAWIAEGNQAEAIFSVSLGTAGDVNGDGYADVIVGAPGYDNGQTDEGAAFVFHGAATGLGTTAAWTAESDQEGGRFGYAVGTAGDVNGDGYADIIVGAYAYDNGQDNEGRVYVYHGAETGLSTTAAWTAESNQVGASFGLPVGTAGDVNGDGYADVIVGAYMYDNGQTDEGGAFVYHGAAAGLSATAAWTAEGNQAYAHLGYYAAGTAGDVNGDGYADVIVGAFGYSNGQDYEGRAYVYHGSASGLNATSAWMAEGDQAEAWFGYSAGTAGDVNGDGYADVIVGAYYYDNDQTDEGRAYVYHGSASGLSATANWMAESNQANAHFGSSSGTAGDVNGDGYADIIVGAYAYDNGQDNEGRAFVYHGSAAGLSATANWTAEGDQGNAFFGDAVATAGDVNGDGYADIVVGATLYDNIQTDKGRASVYHGSASGLSTTANWTAECDQAYAHFGSAAATAGDVNGDGYADVIIGAPLYDNDQTDEGRAYIYYGNASGGLAIHPQQRRADDSAPVAPGGQVISPTEARLAALARVPFGRSDVALQWEVKPEGVAFDGSGLGQGAWTDSDVAGASLNQLISGLSFETRYHWRVRILGRPRNAATNSAVTYRSRWLRPAGAAFFTALSSDQAIGGTGQTNLLGQAATLNVTSLGSPALTNLTLRGYPQTAHPQENAYNGFGGGTQILDRYFSITPNSGAAGYSASLCLNYDDGEVAAAGATEAQLILCRWTGAAWSCHARGAGTDTTANLVCADGVTAFSDWILAQGSPLAVTLAAFTASATVDGVTLAWETISETDNAGFNIYRADSEAGPWVRVNATLLPAAAPGSSVGHAYTWVDATAQPNTAYVYRLEAVALDGTIEIMDAIGVTYRPARRTWLPMVR